MIVLVFFVLDMIAAKAWLNHLVGMGMMGFLSCRVAYSFNQGKDLREGRALRVIAIIFILFGVSLVLDGAFALARDDPNAPPGSSVVGALMLVGLIAGLLVGAIVLMWVMTERIHFRMRQSVSLDGLTGALVRHAFVESFEREVALARRRSDSNFGVLLVNIDHFRRVNDAYGHIAGDRLLVKVTDVIRTLIRQCDVIGRLEGDTFVVLMPATPSAGATATAERIRREIELQASVHAALKNRVTVSIGIAVFNEHGDSWGALLRAADTAIKTAKTHGRNRVEMSAPIEF